MKNNKKLDWALLILRVGLATVFLLFGFQKLSSPSQTTSEIQLILNFLGLGTASAINFYLGLTEIAVGIALITGIKVRLFGGIAAFFTAMFFGSFLIKFGVSINPDIYRDIGLTTAGIAIAILGGGNFTLPQIWRRSDRSDLSRKEQNNKTENGLP